MDETELMRENTLLRAELWAQWEENHAEHCGRGSEWPHPAEKEWACGWELPEILKSGRARTWPAAS